MKTFKNWQFCLLLWSLLLVLGSLPGFAQSKSVSSQQILKEQRDGQHDFDFNFGTWKTHVRRLRHPLTGSTTWVEYEGLSVVRPVWDGRASLFELEVDGPAGHIEGAGLRL